MTSFSVQVHNVELVCRRTNDSNARVLAHAPSSGLREGRGQTHRGRPSSWRRSHPIRRSLCCLAPQLQQTHPTRRFGHFGCTLVLLMQGRGTLLVVLVPGATGSASAALPLPPLPPLAAGASSASASSVASGVGLEGHRWSGKETTAAVCQQRRDGALPEASTRVHCLVNCSMLHMSRARDVRTALPQPACRTLSQPSTTQRCSTRSSVQHSFSRAEPSNLRQGRKAGVEGMQNGVKLVRTRAPPLTRQTQRAGWRLGSKWLCGLHVVMVQRPLVLATLTIETFPS